MTPREISVRDLATVWPGARRHGFGRAVREALDGGEDFLSPGFIPDLFVIDESHRNVVAFEVEDTSRVTSEKIGLYCDYWWGIDGLGWDLILVLVHIDGRPSIGLDVGDLAIARLAEEPSTSGVDAGWRDLAAHLQIGAHALRSLRPVRIGSPPRFRASHDLRSSYGRSWSSARAPPFALV